MYLVLECISEMDAIGGRQADRQASKQAGSEAGRQASKQGVR